MSCAPDPSISYRTGPDDKRTVDLYKTALCCLVQVDKCQMSTAEQEVQREGLLRQMQGVTTIRIQSFPLYLTCLGFFFRCVPLINCKTITVLDIFHKVLRLIADYVIFLGLFDENANHLLTAGTTGTACKVGTFSPGRHEGLRVDEDLLGSSRESLPIRYIS